MRNSEKHFRYGWRSMIERRKELRKKSTKAEELLWEKLKRYKICGYKFRRQHGIGRYVVDFYHGKSRTIIELDGSIHQLDEVKENDLCRQKSLEEIGYYFLRFSNQEVLQNIDGVIYQIEKFINQLQSPSPDKEGEVNEVNGGGR